MMKGLFIGVLLWLTIVGGAVAGHPCAHVLICCRGNNDGTLFEVNGTFVANHDYGDIDQVRDILQKIKEAGIEIVIVDMTNPSQWLRLRDQYEPMVDNIAKVCHEKKMQYFLHIGGGLTPEINKNNNITKEHVPFWNGIAEYIWKKWAQAPEYRKYGFGDERPILLIFRPGHIFNPDYEEALLRDKTSLEKFRIGTVQINDVIDDPMESDGWGYRSKWANKSGEVRYASPNGGVAPDTWHKIDARTWEEQVRWVKDAKEYSVFGSYDDACDSIFWGIADTSESRREHHRYPDPGNTHYYYDILKRVLKEEPEALRYRYAYSADGFNQDRDDVAGSAMTLALFDRLCWSDRLVHFHFNTNFGGKATHGPDHRISVLWTAKLFGMIDEVDGDDGYFDVSESPEEKAAAIDHLANEICRSTPADPLKIFCAGGVQVPYAALKCALDKECSSEALQSVTFLSHSPANEKTRQEGHPEYGVNWSDLIQLTSYPTFIDHTSPEVNARKDGGPMRQDQNRTAWNTCPRKGMQGVAHWQWLAQYGEHVEGFGFSGTKGQWLLTRLKAAGHAGLGHHGNAEADASDTGLVFGQLPGGNTDASMDDIRRFFLSGSLD